MRLTRSSALESLGRQARTVAATLIAAVLRGRDAAQVEDRLARLPLRAQGAVVGAVLLAVFVACLLAAQFGLPGILALLLAVIIAVR